MHFTFHVLFGGMGSEALGDQPDLGLFVLVEKAGMPGPGDLLGEAVPDPFWAGDADDGHLADGVALLPGVGF